MTKFTLLRTAGELKHPAYRIALLAYIIYFAFSPYAFAEKATAPESQDPTLLALAEPASFVKDEVLNAIASPSEFFGLDVNIDEEDTRAAKIAAYFGRYNLPLGDHAEAFVESADRYDIDWRLVAAIGFIESTGGKHACTSVSYSPFGWGSCKINFDSYEDAIDVVSMNLGGANPSTAHYYADKDLEEVLYAYNSVIPNYREKILREMDKIENQEV